MTTKPHLETGKMEAHINNPIHLVALCTSTNKRVIATQQQQITVLQDEAIWWKCPACQGWHINLMRRDEQLVESTELFENSFHNTI